MNLSRAARARALLHGRNYCIADDIHDLAVPVLAHRVRLAAHAEGYVPSRDEAESRGARHRRARPRPALVAERRAMDAAPRDAEPRGDRPQRDALTSGPTPPRPARRPRTSSTPRTVRPVAPGARQLPGRAAAPARAAHAGSGSRAWWRPPRKLKFTREGKYFLGITLGVGFAAINTGNNLLYLLLGMLLVAHHRLGRDERALACASSP